MDENLKKIINYLNNNNLDKAYQLCCQNYNIKIEYIINNLKGVILLKKKKLENAKSNFLKSIELNKNFIDPYKNLLKLNLIKQDFKSAIENGNKVIELDVQKNPLSYFNLALAYDLNKDYKKAIETYKIVETLNFKEKKILFNNIAKCSLGAQQIRNAEYYYLKALEIDQNDKLIVNNLLILYLRIENKTKIEQFFKKAEQIDKNYIEFRLNKSDYFLSKDKIEESINLLKTIVQDQKLYCLY